MADDASLLPPNLDPHDPATDEGIVAAMRADLKAVRQEMSDLKATMLKVQRDGVELKERVLQMPTLLQLITVVIAIWGMAFATLWFADH